MFGCREITCLTPHANNGSRGFRADGRDQFQQLNLPVCTRRSTATHTWHEPPYSAFLLTECTRQAVCESRQSVMRSGPKPAFKYLNFSYSQKLEGQFFLQIPLAHLHTAQHRHLLTARSALQCVGAERGHAARSTRTTSAECFVQVAEANFEKLNFKFSEVGSAYMQTQVYLQVPICTCPYIITQFLPVALYSTENMITQYGWRRVGSPEIVTKLKLPIVVKRGLQGRYVP